MKAPIIEILWSAFTVKDVTSNSFSCPHTNYLSFTFLPLYNTVFHGNLAKNVIFTGYADYFNCAILKISNISSSLPVGIFKRTISQFVSLHYKGA